MRSFLLFSLLLIVSIHRAPAQAVGTWTNNGPIQFPINVSGQVDGMGRVSQVKFSTIDSQKMFAVSASGGLYISYNNGYTWAVTPGTEKMPQGSSSAVCVDYTNENIIYLSTGDANYYNSAFGIYKSTNGGTSFTAANTGIGTAMAVEILMDPQNNANLVAATNNGIWKTTTAAGSWTQEQTGAFKDMKARPRSKNVLYAVTATQFYISTDFGSTWTSVPITTPASNGGLRIAVSAADTNVVYLVTTKGNGQILKSTDGGNSFTNIYSSTTQCIVCYSPGTTSGSQGDYNMDIDANPVNANEVIVVAHCVWRSTDGGLTWTKETDWYNECHTDMHHIQFNPYNPRQIFNANDGGVWMSTDSIKNYWVPRSTGLSATEIYHAAQDPIDRQMLSIGTQDNGELYFDGQWKCNRGGDWSPRCAFDYRTGDVIWYLGTGNRRALSPLTGDATYNSPFTVTNNAAIAFIPNMVNTAFVGRDTIWRSTNINLATPTWSYIYPATETILDIQVSAADSNQLYVLTKSNHLYRSDNALAASPTFTVLATPASTANTGCIATSQRDTNYIYITCGSKIYISKNKGVSWTDISGALPGTNILRAIHDNYSQLERVFLSTGSNVYYKDSTTTTWTACTGLPSVARFSDLMIYNNGTAASTLRLSTYGRGVWEVGINNDHVPIADLNADKKYICPGDSVHFTSTAYGTPTSYSWSFPGGSPAVSAAVNPAVQYTTPGVYNVTLIASNAAGNDTVLKTVYINVSKGAIASFTEGFESATFPPANWRAFSNSGLNWQQTASVGGFGASSHCMLFDNFNNDAGGAHDIMYSSSANLDTAIAAFVTFDVAYSFIPGYRDSLVIKASKDCGQTWTTIYTKDSTRLATTPSTNGLFTPTAAQWRKDTVLLNSFLGKTVMLSFENVGHFGNALYVDNVNISFKKNVGVNTITNALADVQLYPNPTTGMLYINGTGISGSKANIDCYSIVGTLVAHNEVGISNGTLNSSLDLSSLPKGVYEIRIRASDGNSIVKKIVLQ